MVTFLVDLRLFLIPLLARLVILFSLVFALDGNTHNHNDPCIV